MSVMEIFSYSFMLRAFAATTVLACSIGPVGVFLVLRRMSLAGEALAHAIVPGIVVAFIVGGLSVTALLIGGLVAGLGVIALSGGLVRFTILREDAGLASLYLIALAAGIFTLSLAGSAIPLKSFLFGSVLGIDDATLVLIAAVATVTLCSFAFILRPLIVATIDPVFYLSQTGRRSWVEPWFMVLVVLNLLAAFKALGTLMAVGLMILPATAARIWTTTISGLLALTVLIAWVSCWSGLILSFYLPNVPSGPAIVIVAGAVFALSALFAPQGIFRRRPNAGDAPANTPPPTEKKRT
ncbi:MAG: metal ABC transporter permease [Pseudomonadota bacterium]